MDTPDRNAKFISLQIYCPSSIHPNKGHFSQSVKFLLNDKFSLPYTNSLSNLQVFNVANVNTIELRDNIDSELPTY